MTVDTKSPEVEYLQTQSIAASEKKNKAEFPETDLSNKFS